MAVTPPRSHAEAHANLASAVKQLQGSCADDPNCKNLVSLGDHVMREINLSHPTSEEQTEDVPVSEQPKSLKEAAGKAREAFTASRGGRAR